MTATLNGRPAVPKVRILKPIIEAELKADGSIDRNKVRAAYAEKVAALPEAKRPESTVSPTYLDTLISGIRQARRLNEQQQSKKEITVPAFSPLPALLSARDLLVACGNDLSLAHATLDAVHTLQSTETDPCSPRPS